MNSPITLEDVNGIKKLLAFITKKFDDDDDGDLTDTDRDGFVELVKKSPHFNALASQFSFNFPVNVYENFVYNVTKGLDTPFDCSKRDSFCIRFYDKNESESDYYLSNFLTFTGYAGLDTWLDFCDEYHLTLMGHHSPEMTVKDVFAKLIALGFDYSPECTDYIEDDCLFKHELTDLLINNK